MSIPVVYDTMLFFQAASRPDRVHATMKAVFDGRVTLCVSRELIAEVRDVLTRPQHQSRFPSLNPDAVDAFIAEILLRAKMVEVPSTFSWPQHPDDDHVFNLAIDSAAKYLVTWETRIIKLLTASTSAAKTLRRLAPDLTILTPKDFAAEIQRNLHDA